MWKDHAWNGVNVYVDAAAWFGDNYLCSFVASVVSVCVGLVYRFSDFWVFEEFFSQRLQFEDVTAFEKCAGAFDRVVVDILLDISMSIDTQQQSQTSLEIIGNYDIIWCIIAE